MCLLFNYEHLLDTLACDVYKCVCCLTMNIYLTLAWLWRLQMCLLFNYERLLDPGLWRLQMCLLFNYEHLLDPGMTVTFTNVFVV